MNKLLFFIVVTLAFCSCGFESRRQELDERERKLNERAQAIMLREKELKLMEDSLKNYLISKDSAVLAINATSMPLPDSLAGAWDVNMFCTKTNCQGFAVGDTRKEIWILTDKNTTVSVKAMQGNRIIRLYTGTFDGENFNLNVPETGIDSFSTSMNVQLKVESTGKLSGQRSITQNNNCSTVFRIDMSRSDKPLSGI